MTLPRLGLILSTWSAWEAGRFPIIPMSVMQTVETSCSCLVQRFTTRKGATRVDTKTNRRHVLNEKTWIGKVNHGVALQTNSSWWGLIKHKNSRVWSRTRNGWCGHRRRPVFIAALGVPTLCKSDSGHLLHGQPNWFLVSGLLWLLWMKFCHDVLHTQHWILKQALVNKQHRRIRLTTSSVDDTKNTQPISNTCFLSNVWLAGATATVPVGTWMRSNV